MQPEQTVTDLVSPRAIKDRFFVEIKLLVDFRGHRGVRCMLFHEDDVPDDVYRAAGVNDLPGICDLDDDARSLVEQTFSRSEVMALLTHFCADADVEIKVEPATWRWEIGVAMCPSDRTSGRIEFFRDPGWCLTTKISGYFDLYGAEYGRLTTRSSGHRYPTAWTDAEVCDFQVLLECFEHEVAPYHRNGDDNEARRLAVEAAIASGDFVFTRSLLERLLQELCDQRNQRRLQGDPIDPVTGLPWAEVAGPIGSGG